MARPHDGGNGGAVLERPFMHRWRSGVLRSDLSSSTKLTLLVLAEFAGADGSSCYPSTRRIAEFAGVNEKTARRLLQAPCSWFQRFERAGAGQAWRSYGYQLTIPEGADTMPVRWKDDAGGREDTMAARSPEPTGKVRTLTPEGADTMPAEIGLEIGESRAEETAPAKPTERKTRRNEGQTFDEWMSSVPEGEDVVPNDHHVFQYAADAGIPEAFLELGWLEFMERHQEPGSPSSRKRQIDWPGTFSNFVRRGYLRTWRIDRQGGYFLTSAGKQLAIVNGRSDLIESNSD